MGLTSDGLNMPGKGRKIQSRPITALVDLEGEAGLNDNGAVGIREEPSVTLQAIKQIFSHEIGKLETGCNQFKDDV